MDKKECPEVLRLVSKYYDGDINQFEEDYMFSHIHKCEACRQEFNGYKYSIEALRQTEEQNTLTIDMKSFAVGVQEEIKNLHTETISYKFSRFFENLLYQLKELFASRKVQFGMGFALVLILFVFAFKYTSYSNLEPIYVGAEKKIVLDENTYIYKSIPRRSVNTNIDRPALYAPNETLEEKKQVNNTTNKETYENPLIQEVSIKL